MTQSELDEAKLAAFDKGGIARKLAATARLAAKTRQAQDTYFRDRTQPALLKARSLESRLDKVIGRVLEEVDTCGLFALDEAVEAEQTALPGMSA